MTRLLEWALFHVILPKFDTSTTIYLPDHYDNENSISEMQASAW